MPFTVVVPTPVGPLTVTGGEAVHTACFVDGTPTGGDPLGVREALEADCISEGRALEILRYAVERRDLVA